MPARIINVEDARRLAKRRIPKIFFDYIDGGAFAERTLRANSEDFGRWSLEQRVLRTAPNRNLATTYLGRRNALPFMLGPVGFLGLYAANGELKTARAAAAADIPICLSTFSINSITDLRAASQGDLHFQLYVLRDRELAREFIAGAVAARASTLYVTVDTTITSVRERDVRNGFRALQHLTPGLLARLAMRPFWCLEMLRSGMPSVGILKDHPEFGRGALAQATNLSRGIDPDLSWHDIAWLREQWSGRLVVKGVLSGEDAVRACECGADAVVISNHGGRQLDGAASTISILPEVLDAVAGRCEVLIDGGFRRGTDIVKAIALGASGVLLGRAYTYGLAAAGEAGVTRIIELLRDEVDITLALMGLASIDELKARGTSVLRAV